MATDLLGVGKAAFKTGQLLLSEGLLSEKDFMAFEKAWKAYESTTLPFEKFSPTLKDFNALMVEVMRSFIEKVGPGILPEYRKAHVLYTRGILNLGTSAENRTPGEWVKAFRWILVAEKVRYFHRLSQGKEDLRVCGLWLPSFIKKDWLNFLDRDAAPEHLLAEIKAITLRFEQYIEEKRPRVVPVETAFEVTHRSEKKQAGSPQYLRDHPVTGSGATVAIKASDR